MPSNDLIQSVTRSLDLLEYVARADDGLTLQEITQALGVAPPTAHNLARTLVARGYLEKTSRPTRYRLGNGLFELVRLRRQRDFLRRAAVVVQRLAREINGATVTLMEGRGSELLVALRVSPELPGLLQRPDGMTMNGYVAAHGLVFQAFWSDAERAAFRRRYPFDEFGAPTWRGQDKLDEALAEVRRRGYALPAFAGQELFRIAVPIFTAAHTLAASLGVSFHGEDTAFRERATAAVRAAAHQLQEDQYV